MAGTTSQKIRQDLKNGLYKPLYFLQGDEPFYIDEVISYVSEHLLPAKERGMNLLTCYGKEQGLAKIIAQARTWTMLGERKVIIVKSGEEMSDLQRKSGHEALLHYLKAPHEKNILVFSYKNKKLPPKISKEIEKKGVLLTTQKVYESHIPKWIEGYVKGLGYSITPEGSLSLQGLVGNNLELIASELKKAMINFPKGSLLDSEDIMKYVGMRKEVNGLSLLGALAERSGKKTIPLLEQFVSQRKQGKMLILLGLLTTFFSKVLQVYGGATKNDRALAAQLDVHPYFVRQYIRASRFYTLSETMGILQDLHQADLQMKGISAASLSERAILEELVARILIASSLA